MTKTTPRIFVPLWHPPERFESGGLYRARRTLQTMRGFDFQVADSDTTRIDPKLLQGTLRLYRAKALFGPTPRTFSAMRVANYAWSVISLVTIGLTFGSIDGVYVPTSELPHVALAGWLVGKIRRVPIAFCNLNVRGVDVWFANRWLHKNVDAVMTISNALADEIRKEGISRPILVGTVGVDDAAVERNPEPRFDAIFVGRQTREKGVFDLIRAWAIVAKAKPAARLLLAGPVTSPIRQEIESELRRSGLGGSVEIRGAMPEAEKWAAYADAKVCVFPSHIEGFGIVPIEAHFAGISVVAYDLPVFAETIRQSPAAELVPTGDIEALASATLRAISAYPDERAPSARAWAANFTWDKAAALELRLLEQVMQRESTMDRLSQFTTAQFDSLGDNAQKDASFSHRVVGRLLTNGRALGAFLDVGCGTGSVLAAARTYATSLAGVDRSDVFLDRARRALPEARFTLGDACDLSTFEDSSFDTVSLCDVIEHLENPVAAVREIRRVLRPGGRVIVTTPNSDSIFRKVFGRRWFGLSDATHILFFTRFSLTVLLERSGFNVAASATLSSAYAPALNGLIDGLRQGGTLLIVAEKTNAND